MNTLTPFIHILIKPKPLLPLRYNITISLCLVKCQTLISMPEVQLTQQSHKLTTNKINNKPTSVEGISQDLYNTPTHLDKLAILEGSGNAFSAGSSNFNSICMSKRRH